MKLQAIIVFALAVFTVHAFGLMIVMEVDSEKVKFDSYGYETCSECNSIRKVETEYRGDWRTLRGSIFPQKTGKWAWQSKKGDWVNCIHNWSDFSHVEIDIADWDDISNAGRYSITAKWCCFAKQAPYERRSSTMGMRYKAITPSQLLDRYAANRKAIEKHHIKSEEVSEYINSLNADINQLNRLEYESIQNGQLRELTIKESAVKMNDKGSTISSEYSRVSTVIWDGQKWYQVYSNPFPTPHVSISKTDQDKNRYSSVAYGGSCLDGVLYGDLEPVDLIMKKGSPIKVRPVMEKVNGHNCYVIEAATPNGEYTIWIDPEHGYNIAKAETHKSNDDKFLGEVANIKIGDIPGMSTIAKRPGSREAIHFYIDNVNFREVDGVWLPIEANYRIITDYDDQKATYKKHHKRTYVNLKPDFEAIKAFTPKIPEGAIVILDWAPGIRYTWQNGKPVADAAR